jgi:CBS domain-containing protein
MIHPSPAISVRAETPIIDCLRLMRERKVGSLLVMSDDFQYKLLGIFTERDLLMRIQIIQEGGHWQKPIHTVMTHPVLTVDLTDLAQAPRIMLDKGMRHLPVMDESAEGGPRLLGVVSMRDFFTKWALKGEPVSPLLKKIKKGEIQVLSKDSSLLKLLALRASRVKEVESVEEFTRILGLGSSAPLVLDIDLIPALELTGLIKTVLSQDPRPKIYLVFDPTRQPAAVLKLIDGLDQMEGIFAFSRPFNLLALSDAL